MRMAQTLDLRIPANDCGTRSALLEVCVTTVASARAAERGGADRIELCSNLAAGGVSPPPALLASVLRALSIPVHVLVRPRPGDFVFTAAEFDRMCEEVEHARSAGAAGVVTGILLPDGRVDVARTRMLTELARPLHVTFHRAFDETPDVFRALEDVIRAGADTVLTSGGAPDILTGSITLARLRQRADTRLQIMAGGGLRVSNLAEFVRLAGVTCLHGSFTRDSEASRQSPGRLEQRVRDASRLLLSMHAEAVPPQPVL